MDETVRNKKVLSKVLSQPEDGLTSLRSISSNNVSKEDVRKMMNEQKSMMDSNIRIQVRARKYSLIAATLLVVFILGLMIGIVVYKDKRIRKLESEMGKAIKELESMIENSFSDINQRLINLERTRLTRQEETRKERKAALDQFRKEIVATIQEEIERSKKENATSQSI